MVQDGLAAVALVGQHPLRLALAEQLDGLGAVMDLATGHKEVDRQAQFIGQQVDLRRQSSSATPQSLVRAPFCGPWPPADGLKQWWSRS